MRFLNWLTRQNKTRSKVIGHYRNVFQRTGVSGEYVMADLAHHGMLDSNTYVPQDMYATAFNEGRRAMALHIFNMLALNPNDYANQLHYGSAQGEEEDDIQWN